MYTNTNIQMKYVKRLHNSSGYSFKYIKKYQGHKASELWFTSRNNVVMIIVIDSSNQKREDMFGGICLSAFEQDYTKRACFWWKLS